MKTKLFRSLFLGIVLGIVLSNVSIIWFGLSPMCWENQERSYEHEKQIEKLEFRLEHQYKWNKYFIDMIERHYYQGHNIPLPESIEDKEDG